VDTRERRNIVLCAILIAGATVLSYYPSIQNGFTNWDDNHMVTENFMIRSLSAANVVRMFSSLHYAHYHPLVVLSYAVEYHFSGLDPRIYHLTNLVFHVLNSLLVFWLIRSLRGGIVVPLITGVLFGIHPLHVESVAWVTERKDVLYAFFYLAAMILYAKYLKQAKVKYFVYAMVAFLCSLLSKAMAVTLPAVLFLMDYREGRKLTKESIIEKFPAFALSLLFGIVMVYATFHQERQAAAASFTGENILVAFHGLLFYLYKYCYPIPLSALYPYPGRYGNALPTEFTVAPFVVALAALAVLFSMKKTRKVAFWSGFFVVVLIPVLQLTRVGGVIAADRFAYVAVLAPMVATAEGIRWLVMKTAADSAARKYLVFGSTAFVLTALGYLTWNRTKVWKNSVTLWNNVAVQYTGLPVAYNNRGLAFADEKEFGRAIRDYNAGLSLDESDWKLRLNRGNAFREIGAYKAAIADYDSCLKQFPTNSDAYYYRGLVHQYLNEAQPAIDDYTQAIALNPSRYEAFVNRGTIYAQLKEYDNALKDFDVALAINPEDADIHSNKGMLYRITSRYREALVELNQALYLQPQNAKTLNQRGMVYFALGQFDKAIEDYDEALHIEPSNAIYFNNRGAARYQQRDFLGALADYNTAISLSPMYADAITNRAFAFSALKQFREAKADIKKLEHLKAWVDPRLIELTADSTKEN
jgi:tetratricopeptide (TPR) repeat protein